MTPYSQDLRKRVLDTVERGEESLRQIAQSVPGQPRLRHPAGAAPPRHRLPPTQTPWRRQPTGPQSGGFGTAPGAGPTAARCHPRGIAPAARRLVLPHDHRARPGQTGAAAQKEGPPRQEQDRPEVQEKRQEFCEEMADIDPHRLVFVDECGANTALTRTHGRAPAGQRVYTNTPGHWESITLTCGLRLCGVTAALAFPAPPIPPCSRTTWKMSWSRS